MLDLHTPGLAMPALGYQIARLSGSRFGFLNLALPWLHLLGHRYIDPRFRQAYV